MKTFKSNAQDSLFDIAEDQEVDRVFVKIYYLPSYNVCIY